MITKNEMKEFLNLYDEFIYERQREFKMDNRFKDFMEHLRKKVIYEKEEQKEEG